MNQDRSEVTIRFRPRAQYLDEGDKPAVIEAIVTDQFADAFWLLARRHRFGVHLDALGGRDILAELAMHRVPVKIEAMADRGTGADRCWAIADFDLVGADSDASRA